MKKHLKDIYECSTAEEENKKLKRLLTQHHERLCDMLAGKPVNEGWVYAGTKLCKETITAIGIYMPTPTNPPKPNKPNQVA